MLLSFAECFQNLNVPLCQLRGTDRDRQNIADFHEVIDQERTGYDVRTVQLLADDPAADGISVDPDQHVEQGGTVTDIELTVTVHGAQYFFGEIEGVVAALLEAEARIRLQILRGYGVLGSERIVSSDKDMWPDDEKPGEGEPLVPQCFSKDGLIEAVQI